MDLSSYQTFIDTAQCDDRVTNESLVLTFQDIPGFDITITQRMVMGRLPIPGGICSLLPARYNRTLLGNKVGWHKLYRVHFYGMVLAEFHHSASCQLTDFIRGYFPLLISLASLDRLKDFRYRGRVRFIDAQPSRYMPSSTHLQPTSPSHGSHCSRTPHSACCTSWQSCTTATRPRNSPYCPRMRKKCWYIILWTA